MSYIRQTVLGSLLYNHPTKKKAYYLGNHSKIGIVFFFTEPFPWSKIETQMTYFTGFGQDSHNNKCEMFDYLEESIEKEIYEC